MENKTTWVTDPTHSEVQFKIKHLVISTVTGSFRTFEGRAITNGNDFNHAKIKLTIDVKSIDTNQAQRDEHLQNGDFFASDLYPTIDFESTSFEKVSGKKLNYKIGKRRPGDVVAIYANNNLAVTKLNWQIKFNLDDMMRTAWEWELNISKDEKLMQHQNHVLN